MLLVILTGRTPCAKDMRAIMMLVRALDGTDTGLGNRTVVVV